MKNTSRFILLSVTWLTFFLSSAIGFCADWPTYMHDNERTGITEETLTLPIGLQWIHESRHAPQPAWPPAAKRNHWGNQILSQRVTFDRAHHVVMAEGRIYFGTSADDKVICLDQKTGQQRWQFFAEGPVRLAPSLNDGKVYFGSDDGFVYCLAADDGQLLWKKRIAPEARRIPGNERIISAWPVRSGVMVLDENIRCTAGIFPRQGAYQFALDASTGKKLAQGAFNISPQGYLQLRDDRLYFDSGRSGMIFLSRIKRRGISPIELRKQSDKTQPRPSSFIGTANLRFLGGDGVVKALDARTGQQQWSFHVDGKVHSLAVSNGSLLVSTDQGKLYCFNNEAQPDDLPRITPSTELPAEDALAYKMRDFAKQILAKTKMTQGYCLVIGSGSGRLAYELARRSELRIIGVESDEQMVAESRQMLDQAGVYGTRVAIHHGPLDELPYADYLFNLVVSERLLTDSQLPGRAAEVQRVVHPGRGFACFATEQADLATWTQDVADFTLLNSEKGSGAIYRRDPLAGTGEWTHLYADPSNSVCSGDTHIGDKLRIQWFGPPGPRNMVDRHFRTTSPLYQHGRVFVPGDNYLFAVDAYNGRPLWERPLPGFRRIGVGRDAGTMVLTDDLLYVLSEDKCRVLSVVDGMQQTKFPVPGTSGDNPHRWGYLAAIGENLYGSANKPGASRSELTRGAILEVYQDYFPLITSDYLFSMDRRTGSVRWKYEKNRGAIINPSIAIGEKHLFFIESHNPATLREDGGRSTLKSLAEKGADVVALDLNTGTPVWRQTVDLTMLDHDVYLTVAGGRVILSGSGNVGEGDDAQLNRHLITFDAAKGTPGWRHLQPTMFGHNGFHGEQNMRPVVVGDRLYFQPYAYDLASGKRVPDWKMIAKRKGCGMVTASKSAFYFRHQHCNVLDLASQRQSEVTHVTRPGCWINILPVGGMLLIPESSSGCACAHSVQTSIAFVPAGGAAGEQD